MFEDRKIGFCFFDTTPKRLSLPRDVSRLASTL